MTTTFAYTPNNYGSGNMTAPTPSGSGGVLVVFTGSRDGNPVPQTPADWTSIANIGGGDAAVKAWWALDSDTPNMVFTRATGEAGIGCYRIANADVSSPDVKFTGGVDEFSPTSIYIGTVGPNVPTNAVGIVIFGMQGSANAIVSTDLAFTQDYEGLIGSEGWWAGDIASAHLDPIEVDPDTNWYAENALLNGECDYLNVLVITVKTTPPGTAPSAVTDLSGVPANAQVALSWTAPDDGGSAITGYDIDWALASAPTMWLGPVSTGSSTPGYTKLSLTNSVGYVFRVRAVNAIGNGAWSSSTGTITPAPTTGYRLTMAGDQVLTMSGGFLTLMGGAPASPPGASILKRWNGSSWESVVLKHGAGWPVVQLTAV